MSTATVFGLLDTCNGSESRFCIIDELPRAKGLSNVDAANAARGDRAAHLYPADVRLRMSKEFGGTELADIVANTEGLLLVHMRVKRIIERVNRGKIELIPVPIHDHDDRLASKDYFVVNPLGTHDVLDLRKSQIEWGNKKTRDVIHVEKMVLAPAKLEKAPDLFRPKESPESYIISKNIARELVKLRPKITNLHYLDIFVL